jgi:hypothetical protein
LAIGKVDQVFLDPHGQIILALSSWTLHDLPDR